MLVKVVLVDVNPRMVQAWQATFEENPEVDVVLGSMLEQPVDAWVSPTNSKGSMDGGLDAVIKGHLGGQIEGRVQKEIGRVHGGFLPVGHSTCVPTGTNTPRYLISTPTMTASSQDISDSLNVALACAAAFQAVHIQNARDPGSIRSVALPGLGANTGKVPVEICADLMWTGYNLFRSQEFTDFDDMRAALEEQLGELEPDAKPKKKPTPGTIPSKGGNGPVAKPSAPTKQDIDFDDAE
ncbi:MAG: macro domain-containing protein [Gemmataceae bacterium]|nr:macro domain-containing protein [Gemmataceae bacterium]